MLTPVPTWHDWGRRSVSKSGACSAEQCAHSNSTTCVNYACACKTGNDNERYKRQCNGTNHDVAIVCSLGHIYIRSRGCTRGAVSCADTAFRRRPPWLAPSKLGTRPDDPLLASLPSSRLVAACIFLRLYPFFSNGLQQKGLRCFAMDAGLHCHDGLAASSLFSQCIHGCMSECMI